MLHLRRFWLATLVLIALLGSACTPVAAPPPAPFTRTVDLSHVVREDMPQLPDEPLTRLVRDQQGRIYQLSLGLRTGSVLHVAAAADAEVTHSEALSPRDLVVPAVVIDARAQAQNQPAFRLSRADILAWEQRHGLIPAGSVVLLATGWDLHWGDSAAYLNLGPDQQPQVPGYAPETATFLLEQRQVAGLGLDTPLLAYTPSQGFALLLENLTNLEQVPPTGSTLVIGALRLQRAQRSPARVLALVP
ncbi:MAG: cyclase family protein [Oscillochloridaceae bacterium umkhey_bin13]